MATRGKVNVAKAGARGVLAAGLAAATMLGAALPATAGHSWGSYHWARTANPFTLKLGDNVNSAWDGYLVTTSSDWNKSSVLQTTIVTGGTTPRTCRPTAGRVEVCNASYGSTGWLGVAQIWASGSHITQGTAKLNDTYFNTAKYNTPAWRLMVMCQEVAHTFGLDHQDETFDNPNLGSCMDYTSNPAGPPSNEHPNQHDYDQLVTIYTHTDSTTTVSTGTAGSQHGAAEDGGDSPAMWGTPVAYYRDGRARVYVRDLGAGQRLITFVIWAEDAPQRHH